MSRSVEQSGSDDERRRRRPSCRFAQKMNVSASWQRSHVNTSATTHSAVTAANTLAAVYQNIVSVDVL